jgi:hypothetical protein
MDPATVVAALLQDKKIGPDFIADRKLSEDLFLHGWNTRDLLEGTPLQRSHHLLGMINAPPIHDFPADACASSLTPSADDTRAFLDLNLAFIRLSPRHRIWEPADVAYLHQRRPVAGSFMLISSPTDPSSAPVLVITGPLALPLNGTPIQTRAAFGLDPSAPLNLVEGQPMLPSGLLPTSAILDSTTRCGWDAQTRLGDQLALLHATARALHILDSRPLHSTVLAVDTTEGLGRLVRDCSPISSLSIWAPAAPAQPGFSRPRLEDKTFGDWVRTTSIPPDPADPDLWTYADTSGAENPTFTRTSYKSPLADKVAYINASAYAPTIPGSFILLPRFIRLPFSVTVPVGLVFDPKDISFPQFRALVAFTCHGGDMAATSWMENPLLIAWYNAARLCPTSFSVPAIEHSAFIRYFPSSLPPPAQSIVKHQLWSILSNILWDRIFGLARRGRQQKLKVYCVAALERINHRALAGAYDWGPIHTVYGHPFVPFLVPTQYKIWLKEFLWQEYPSLSDTFPAYMDDLRPATPLITDDSTSRQTSPTHGQGTETVAGSLLVDTALGDFLDHADLQPHQFGTPPPPPIKRRRGSHGDDLELPLPPTSLERRLLRSTNTDNVVVTHVTAWDPLQSLRGTGRSAVSDEWSLPLHQARQSPLPCKNGFTVAHNLALALHFFGSTSPTSMSQTASTAGSDVSKDKLSYLFSLEMMLRADAPAHLTVRRAAFFGSFRYPEPDVHPLYAVGMNAPPLAVYPTDALLCPGMLSATFIPFLHPAHDKPVPSMHFKRLHAHVRDLCLDAMQSEEQSGIECRWQQDFLTAEVVQAVQHYAFHSGKRPSHLSDLHSILTPWHFLHSVSSHHHPSRPVQLRLPLGGLPAIMILDVFQNMYFLMHLPFLDTCKLAYVGPQHSPASRWSPFFGHFLRVINMFHDRNFQYHWDSCAGAIRGRLTEAIFIAVSELIAIFERWCTPKFDVSQTFFQARYSLQSFDTVVLLNPLVDTNGTKLSTALQAWRQHLVPFSVSGLQCALPTDGFFAIPTPECFRPSSFSLPSTTDSTVSLPPPPQAISAPPSQPSSHHSSTPASTRREGESHPTRKARTCMLVQPDTSKSLGAVLRQFNKDRPAVDHLKTPLASVSGRRPIPLCFRFTTEQCPGCPNPRCRFLHLDMANVNEWRNSIPSEFFQQLQRFLDAPAVKPYYQPSSAFRDFLSRR